MTDSTDSGKKPYENINVEANLSTELKKLRQDHPQRFSIQIDILATVDGNINDQWEERLLETQQDQTENRIILIPYKVGNVHWIGILMLIKSDGHVEKAEFMDPVEKSRFDPSKLQKQFSKIYPNVILTSKVLKKHADTNQSAALTVKNLIEAVKQTQSMDTSEGNYSPRDSNVDSEERNNEREVPTNISIEEECFVTEENLKNMYDDFNSMPPCLEKSIISLLFYVALKLVGNTITLDHSIKLPDQIDAQIEKEFDYLKERSEKEEVQSAEIRKSIQTSFINAKNENWKLVWNELRKVLKNIRPLDIQELFRLVDKVNDAAILIENKEVILFLGGTGSGKSTTIHFLAGSKMIQTKIKGINHIAPTEIKNPALFKVTTSPFSRSETRYMTPVPVNFEDVGVYGSGSIILCDSPGFEDTSGAEVDIANGIGIIKAIKGCKSVKPVVLFSFKGIGDRFEGLKKLTHVLVGLIPGIQDHIRSFSYLFTKFPPDERKTIHASLENIFKEMNDTEKSDVGLMTFFEEMLNTTKYRPRVIDPINDNPAELLRELAKAAAIHHPDEVFRFSITEKSKAIVQEQARKHQFSIMSATKRFEYSLVKYKLDELKRLSDLLGHNSLEQIYNECVQCISKHLSEEYDEGISTLNRCLKNQIIISIEDVKQYETRIKHAKHAEDLRKEHLGTDVVQTSAFIQYLNQQVTMILDDLQEKDINDLSIKIALDKIKLLSNSFLEITNNYNAVCQRLTEKFDNVVDCFKNSVRSKEFDSCASEITKLYEALTILRDHLNLKNMEQKYAELKEYFLKYLNDSVRKLDPIFTQEKLEKNDVDALNNCICMLESAITTYALYPHISKESINVIYEGLLSNISNYFEEILAKINTLFKNKSDSLFQVSEQLVKEMTLIRTIPSIQYKTNRSYFSTLEKLSGYIKESKNFVEEKLRKFRQHEEEINYGRLTQYLSNLKHAKWVEEYRNDVYKDVMNEIEEYIIEHLEGLKNLVIEINLDLDNFDKIESVNKIISEINEIKRVEKVIEGVGQHIDEANSWFVEATNKILVMIKDTYCSEKWEKQRYQALDFDKIEKAFSYLDACKKVPRLFKGDCILILNGLEQFIRNFSNFIQNEMHNCFEDIKQYRYENQKDINAKARILSNRLREISEIKKNHPRIFSCFLNKKIFEDWQKELASFADELVDELEKLKNIKRMDDVNNKLLIIKELRRVDEFLVDGKFNNLHRDYQKMFSLQTNDAGKHVLDAIQKSDYARVSSEMVALRSANEVGEQLFQHAKRTLRASIDTLMDEVKRKAMIGENIDTSEISSIVDHLKQIKKANESLSEYLDMSKEINEFTEEVIKLIGNRIERFLEKIRALINACDFLEAQQEIELITAVRAILGKNYCTDNVYKKIEELDKVQKDAVESVIQRYNKLNITEYVAHQPIETFKKFDKVRNRNPMYKAALDTIKEVIIAKFRAEIGRIASKILSDPESIFLKRLECALEYLPEEIQKVVKLDLEHSTKESHQTILSSNRKLDDAFNTGDVKNIKSVLEEYQNSTGMQIFVDKGRQLALKQMQEMASKIFENLNQYDIKEALINLRKLGDYKIELNSIVKENSQFQSDVESRVKDTFQKAYSCVINQFLHTNISVISNEIIQAVEKSFICLIEFMKFRDEVTDQSILTKLLPNNFDETINELHEKFFNYISELQKNYEIALEQMNFASLQNTLTTICKWNSLFTKINQYEKMISQIHTSVNAIIIILKNLESYSQMIKSISDKIKELSDELMSQQLINDNTKKFSHERNEFYSRLNEKFSILNQANLLSSFNGIINVNKIEQDCAKSYEKKLTEICSSIEKFLKKYLEDSRLTTQEYDSFNLYYNNLISFSQQINVTFCQINDQIKEIDNKVLSKIFLWGDLSQKSAKIEDIALYLINMKRISNNIPSFKVEINNQIDTVLNYHKNTAKLNATFVKFAAVLNKDNEGVGQTIISEHHAFQGYALCIFNEKVLRHGINYVLEYLKADAIDKDRLKKRYEECYTLYRNVVEQYLKPNIELDKLISDTKLIIGDIKQHSDRIQWDAGIRNEVPKLIAHVFALWTLKNANHYFEAIDLKDRNNFLLQPHAAQIVSILRMLSIADQKEELNNNLVQIGTGEGKSVTLAVTACVLALFGFDVWCVCYSEHLSTRDYAAFQSLFDSLGLLEHIHYGTFNKLSEDLINENGEVRQVVEQLISGNSNIVMQNSKQKKRAKILLIDEVDVFFSRDFYGNVYTPLARLRHPTITSLVNLIWTRRAEKLNLNKVKSTSQYEACCNQFPNWEPLIEEAVKDMLSDVKNFESHDYVVSQDKIGYIEQDDVVYNIAYGYKTLFAYYLEHGKGKISKERLEENISITIKCGSFSYAQIPFEFKYIMGVTGTLETLNELEKEIIQKEYKIKKYTYIPSVFGKNNLRFIEKDDVMIENSNDYFNVIAREINDKLGDQHSSGKRAVLVFFESKKKLMEFYNSKSLATIKDSVTYLTEEVSLEEKTHCIKRATMSGQITLFTKTYGRGTDFICYDQTVSTSGGIHVIQTFLSEEESEEVQIKGRTARQGDRGSYSIVLLDLDLEKFHIEKQNIQDVREGKRITISVSGKLGTSTTTKVYKTVHAFLQDKRAELFKIQYETNKKFVEIARERHKIAQNFLSSLKSEDLASMKSFLVEENRGVEEGACSSRTVILMDATGSMANLLNNCKTTIETMFRRASEILRDSQIKSDTFEIQLVVYRNYNCQENKILQSSAWETRPDNLRTFMNTIKVEGGWGNEAIEIGLWHANKENETEGITQVILIGDAPPNSRNEVSGKRKHAGEDYWQKTKFAQATYYEDVLENLISKNIPVHCFYIRQRAEISFKEIANRTGGQCAMLDIDSDQGSEMLTNLVTREILRNAGGNDLVEEYDRRHARGHL